MTRHALMTALLLPALLLGACGAPAAPEVTGSVATGPGLTGPVTPAPDPAPNTSAAAKLTVQLVVPTAAAARTQALRASYVSAGTTSVRVQLRSPSGASVVDQTFVLGPTLCTPVTAGQLCRFAVPTASGRYTLTVSALGDQHQVLSRAITPVTLQAGQENPLDATLTGVPAQAQLLVQDRADEVDTAAQPGTIKLERGGRYLLAVHLQDAAGQLILDAGTPELAPESANPDFTVQLVSPGLYSVTVPAPAAAEQRAQLTLRPTDAASGAATPLTQVQLSVPPAHLALQQDSASPQAGGTLGLHAELRSYKDRPLAQAGLPLTFSVPGGHFVGGGETLTVRTDASGAASATLQLGEQRGEHGVVAVSGGGLTASAPEYASVAAAADLAHSQVNVYAHSLASGGSTVLLVSLQDRYGNPVEHTPEVVARGAVQVGSVTQHVGNVSSFPVQAGQAPGSGTLEVRVDGQLLTSVAMQVLATPLQLSYAGAPVGTGSYFEFGAEPGSQDTFELQLAEPGDAGRYRATSSRPEVATASLGARDASGNAALLVTRGAVAGEAEITVQDGQGQSLTFTVRTTALTLTLH